MKKIYVVFLTLLSFGFYSCESEDSQPPEELFQTWQVVSMRLAQNNWEECSVRDNCLTPLFFVTFEESGEIRSEFPGDFGEIEQEVSTIVWLDQYDRFTVDYNDGTDGGISEIVSLSSNQMILHFFEDEELVQKLTLKSI